MKETRATRLQEIEKMADVASALEATSLTTYVASNAMYVHKPATNGKLVDMVQNGAMCVLNAVEELVPFVQAMCGTPVSKLRYGEKLSEQEYYFLRAHRVLPDLSRVLQVWDEAEYSMYLRLYYRCDDNRVRGVINPEKTLLTRRSPRLVEPQPIAPVGLIKPSEVRRSRLDEAQLHCFEVHFPLDLADMRP